MKSNIEKVYSKLPKTELAKVELEKVELSIVDDLKKLEQEYMNTYADTGEVRKLGVLLKKKARSAFDDLSKTENKIKQALKEFEQMAKDLGIKPTSVKEYKSLIDSAKSIPNYLRIYKQAMELNTL
jgi:regulator of replication initiation timing